ncbi:transmembrane protein 180-like isoform X2 [Mercenaria mercenaria]|uniref:transmembrane protein 180-like isoform X2 n=1 Tax=Mercenaria mercenaria TaxID=6596 RepID=UPI00234F8F7F|nr:transmembrane protein 180-like isoform X2 [Mercenaria mercenaria]
MGISSEYQCNKLRKKSSMNKKKIKMFQSSLHSRVVALGALHMGFSMLSAAFGFYYVKVFLNFYHIEESWFQVSQSILLVWNTVNDPLIAYFQDSTNFACTRTRRESVLYAAPFFALSFLVPWFPWGKPDFLQPWVTGVHLITTLCFFDTMFTYVGLASSCLFTEISADNDERLTMIRYNQIGNLLGCSSVFMLEYISNQLENFKAFQTTCIILAVISTLLLRYCGKHAHTELELRHENDMQNGKPRVLKSQEYSYLTLTKQIFFTKDFLAFAVMNFLAGFHRVFLSNFFTIFGDQLISKDVVPPVVRSLFYGASSTASKLIVIFGAGVVGRFGYYKVIRYSQLFMIAYGLIYYMTGPINHWCLMFFMLLDSGTSNSVHTLYGLAISDIADQDRTRYRRSNDGFFWTSW